MKNPFNGNFWSVLKIIGFVFLVASFAAGAVAYVHGMAADLRTEREARLAVLASKDAVSALHEDLCDLRAEQKSFRAEVREDLRLIASKMDGLAAPK